MFGLPGIDLESIAARTVLQNYSLHEAAATAAAAIAIATTAAAKTMFESTGLKQT